MKRQKTAFLTRLLAGNAVFEWENKDGNYLLLNYMASGYMASGDDHNFSKSGAAF